jgi:predicted Zn-dependent protease
MAEIALRRRFRPSFERVLMLLAAAVLALVAQPAAAQSLLRDAETEALFRDIAAPLAQAAGLRPGDLKIALVQDSDINAFVIGGQTVYVNSGLITKADNVNQLQGVVAHEVGHIAGGHIISSEAGMRQATSISILSLVLGLVAIAAGAGAAGAGILAAGQQAAMGSALAFTRTQESSADQAGATFLTRAGISGRGFIQFFDKLQNMEYRLAVPQEDSYARTHPLNSERIAALQQRLSADPAWDRPTPPELEERFQRVRAKLAGYVDPPERVFRQYPETDHSIPARYARAYAWHRSAHPDRALAEADSLLADRPHDPYFLELKGQILLESGRPAEALSILREAVAGSHNEPLIAALFGHALMATEDPANFTEAEHVLRVAVARDQENPFAWYQLGVVYDREGDMGRAALATAERYSLTNEPRLAMVNAQQAMAGIPANTPDWIRAQDIVMASRSALDRQGHNRRR